MPTHPSDSLAASIDRARSPICVGLDPVLANLPAPLRDLEPHAAIQRFSLDVIDAVAPHAAAIKFQSACYERFGSKGFAALESAAAHARNNGLTVVLDAKRGDIGQSSAHYAAAALALGAHFVTVNGYLGPSGIEPFLSENLGAFVLVRTSNPDSDAVQAHQLSDGRSVAEMIADHVAALGASRLGSRGLSDVGAVVGATKAGEGLALRKRMPRQIFLVPGYGAQGGTADDVRSLLRPGEPAPTSGVLVTSSRAIIYAQPGAGEPWTDAVHAAAKRMRDEIAAIINPT
jgi:orotidine-5'-phosphate decarboxylase